MCLHILKDYLSDSNVSTFTAKAVPVIVRIRQALRRCLTFRANHGCRASSLDFLPCYIRKYFFFSCKKRNLGLGQTGLA